MTEEDIRTILKALDFGWSEVTNAYTMLRSLSKLGYQLVPPAPAIPAQQAGQPEDAKDAARLDFLLCTLKSADKLDRVIDIIHDTDGFPLPRARAIAAIDAAMSSPTAKKGEGA